jgi:hypothetical protein
MKTKELIPLSRLKIGSFVEMTVCGSDCNSMYEGCSGTITNIDGEVIYVDIQNGHNPGRNIAFIIRKGKWGCLLRDWDD